MALSQEAAQTREEADRLERSAGVPRVIRYSGVIRNEAGAPVQGAVPVTFSLYDSSVGGAPLWVETQNVTVDESGRYTVLLGASSRQGLPLALFAAGEVRFLGVRQAVEGQAEGQRVALVSVPYALSAGDAQSLGGRPVTDFVLTRTAQTTGGDVQAAQSESFATSGTAGFIGKFTNSTDLSDSVMFELNGNIGIGTLNPLRGLHIRGGSGAMLLDAGNVSSDPVIFMTHDNLPNPFRNYITANRADERVDIVSQGMTTITFKGPNVGIGTTAPQRGLHIRGGAGAMIMDAGNTASDPVVFLAHDNFANAFRNYFTANRSDERVDIIATGVSTATFKAGNVGIGTISPTSRLEVTHAVATQSMKVTNNAAGASEFSVSVPPPVAIRGDATSATGVTAGVLGITSAVQGRGVLGESLSSTGQNMGVYGVAVNSPDGSGVWGEATSTTGDAAGVFGRSQSSTGTGVFGEAVATSGDAVGVAGISRAAGGTGVMGEVTATTGENYAVAGRVFNTNNTSSTAGMFINTGAGSILLGRTSTAGGAANVFRVATNGQVFGSAFNTSGADFAESVAVKEDKSEYVPGDVIAIDTTGVRRFAKVAQPYSTLVAGIYSTKPGILASPHHPEDPRIAAQEIPLAVVGIVPCKVTDENGEIRAGDLLVSSSRAGYAMKGTDRSRMNGAVIGKALQPMKGKTGVIEVLVSLQ